jgi:hypothetical protein
MNIKHKAMKAITIFIVMLLSFQFTFGQKNYSKILLENAFIHMGNGQTMPTGTIGIEKGTIILVKNTLAYTVDRSNWDTIIDLKGQHLYPGFVAPNSTLGLTEIDAARATLDFQEIGTINPHVRAQIAYNCESKVIETVRSNGILLIQSTPRGGLISGQSSVMLSSCWNWEDGTALKDDGIHINWPSVYQQKWGEKKVTKQESYETKKQELSSFLSHAKVATSSKEVSSALYAPFSNCFKGTKRMYFHADDAQQLSDIIDLVELLEIPYPVIVGGYESYLVAERLKRKKIPVMLGRLHSLPKHDDDPTNLPYTLPFLLQQAGVLFCLQNEGDMEAMNARNLPFLAGTAMGYGLTEEEAVRVVTLSACEIMGIDKNYGSIEVGKKATLFVSVGSALEMKTNQVTTILVNGKFVSPVTFQTELYHKYEQKYQQNK